MLPLTVDDLLPLEEYASKRKEYFDAHRRYVDRYRVFPGRRVRDSGSSV